MTATILLQTKVEAAIGADLTAHPATWTWTDLTRRTTAGSRTTVHQQNFTARRGRANEAAVAQPTTFSFTIDNPDGAFTPQHPESIWHPNIDLGMPVRAWINAGSPHLSLTGASGSRAGTPDHASLDITGDWTIIVELVPPIWIPPAGTNYELAGKFNTTGNQRSILLFVDTDGLLKLRWSTDGTAAGELNAESSEAFPLSDGGPLTLGAYLDVNNGAAGRTTTFYALRGTITDLLADPTAYILGTPDTDAGTTSVFSSTAPLDVGDVTGSGFSPYPGQVNRLQARSGSTAGSIVANPDFTAQAVGATSFADSAGRTWTVSSATIDKWRVRFSGEVSDLSPRWQAGNLPGWSVVDVTATGPIRRLQQGAKPLGSALFRTITAPINADAVHAYWPAEDGKDSEFAYSPIDGVKPGVIRMDYAADDTLDSSQPLPHSSDTHGWAFPIPSTVPTTGWQITWLMRIDTPETSPASTTINMIDATGTVERWRLRISNDNVNLRAFDVDETSLLDDNTTIDDRCFDTWMIVTLAISQDGADVDWDLDLIPIPLGVVFGDSGTIASRTCGRPTRIHTPTLSDSPADGISVGHFIVTTDRSSGWLAPADTAYVGEPAPQRIARLCEEQDIPIVVYGPYGTDWAAGILDGAQAMGPQRPATFTELLADCAKADLGFLGEQRHRNGLLYRAGVTLQNQSPRLTLDYADGQVIEPWRPVLDDQRYSNDVTVERVDGGSARVVDAEVEAGTKARYESSTTVNVASDLNVPDQAGWRHHIGTWPDMRYPSVTADVAFNLTDLADDWLDATEGDLVRITNLPDGHPPDDVDLLIEGSNDTWTQYTWAPEIVASPAGPWEVGIREDDTRGKRDTAGSELASGITDSATSASVTTTSGPVWSDDAAEDPFDIDIGGEQITVTNVTNATSPQTFALTRSVNGVTKAHSAGAAVRLWRPTIRAL